MTVGEFLTKIASAEEQYGSEIHEFDLHTTISDGDITYVGAPDQLIMIGALNMFDLRATERLNAWPTNEMHTSEGELL